MSNHHSKNKLVWRVAITVSIAFLALVLWNLYWAGGVTRPWKGNPKDLPGIYVGRYRGGQQTIELRSDKTYSQTIVSKSGTTWKRTGSWILEQIHGRPALELDDAYLLQNAQTDITAPFGPVDLECRVYSIYFRHRKSGVSLKMGFAGNPYWVRRISTTSNRDNLRPP